MCVRIHRGRIISRMLRTHKTHAWWRACRRIRDPPASNTHEHTSTLRHTLEQRAYLQSANGEVERDTERERERQDSTRWREEVECGKPRERERQRCTNHICSLHCHHSSCFLMEQTVPWGRKITNEISGISQWFPLDRKEIEWGNPYFLHHYFLYCFHWKHPENKMILLDLCLCLKVGFICFKSAEQLEVQHDFTQDKLI